MFLYFKDIKDCLFPLVLNLNIILILLQFNVPIELYFVCIPQHQFSILAMWQHKRLVMIFQIHKHKNSNNSYNALYFYFIFLLWLIMISV